MEKGMTLYQLSEQMLAIEEELYENGGELTPELEAAMTETRESLLSKVDGYNALYRELGSKAEAIKSEIDRLTKLKKTAENAQKRLKERLLYNMNLFGLKKLEGRCCKMSIRKSKSLNVDEEAMLFPFRREIDRLNGILPAYVTVECKVSRKMINDEFKDTDILPAGCERVENESLQIR